MCLEVLLDFAITGFAASENCPCPASSGWSMLAADFTGDTGAANEGWFGTPSEPPLPLLSSLPPAPPSASLSSSESSSLSSTICRVGRNNSSDERGSRSRRQCQEQVKSSLMTYECLLQEDWAHFLGPLPFHYCCTLLYASRPFALHLPPPHAHLLPSIDWACLLASPSAHLGRL